LISGVSEAPLPEVIGEALVWLTRFVGGGAPRTPWTFGSNTNTFPPPVVAPATRSVASLRNATNGLVKVRSVVSEGLSEEAFPVLALEPPAPLTRTLALGSVWAVWSKRKMLVPAGFRDWLGTTLLAVLV